MLCATNAAHVTALQPISYAPLSSNTIKKTNNHNATKDETRNLSRSDLG